MAIVDLVLLALAVLVGVLVLQNRRDRTPSDAPRPVDPDAQRLADEVIELRARIQVLERVITDNHGSNDLAQEIDRLRDR